MVDGLIDKKNLIKMDEASMCGISGIPQNLQIWSHTEIIGDDIIYLPHLGLFFCRVFCFYEYYGENNHCQAESTDSIDRLLEIVKGIIFSELHAIKGLLLTRILHDI